MKVHANAALGPAGRLALVEAIESGMTQKAAAAAFCVAPATARRWWHRWRLADEEQRSSGRWLADRYMRFWLRFVNRKVDLIERGRGSLLLDDFRERWPSFRGMAIEPLVRDAFERLLPDSERFRTARYAGSYWNRSGSVEVDLVGGDTWPVAKRVSLVDSVKWRARRRFNRTDALELAARRVQVPGTSEKTLLVGVSSRGFDPDVPLDVQLSPQDLLGAWRHDE